MYVAQPRNYTSLCLPHFSFPCSCTRRISSWPWRWYAVEGPWIMTEDGFIYINNQVIVDLIVVTGFSPALVVLGSSHFAPYSRNLFQSNIELLPSLGRPTPLLRITSSAGGGGVEVGNDERASSQTHPHPPRDAARVHASSPLPRHPIPIQNFFQI